MQSRVGDRLRAGFHGAPSPTHVGKSQHGGKVPTFEPQETNRIWMIVFKVGVWIFYAKHFAGLVLNDGSSFLFDPILYTSPKPCLQKSVDVWLGTRDPCEGWVPTSHALNGWNCTDGPQMTRDLGLGTPCEVVSPNLHALNGWDCTDWRHVTRDLGLGAPCEPALRLDMDSCDVVWALEMSLKLPGWLLKARNLKSI